VPRPTNNGEIWVFNKDFTQYIPLSLYDVLVWMGSPSIYVWDCSNAGLVVRHFLDYEEEREQEYKQQHKNSQLVQQQLNAQVQIENNSSSSYIQNQQSPILNMRVERDSIHLAACGSNESLPTHAIHMLPLDIFTACLTTPLKAAVYWHVAQRRSGGSACCAQLVNGLTNELLEQLPGHVADRRTMVGELNWIFTAITDTIAWTTLGGGELFQRLFRQDLLVASLFRNFLLAERVMKSLDVTPVSHPALPSTHEHTLWQSWDLALDMCLSQLPKMAAAQQQNTEKTSEALVNKTKKNIYLFIFFSSSFSGFNL